MMTKPVIGAQLFTLRQFAKTPDDIARMLERVAKIGYTTVQASGLGPIEPAELAQLAFDCGLTICATHVPWYDFLEDIDGLIEKHKTLSCLHPAIGSLPKEYHSLDGLKRFIDELGPVLEHLKAAGMDFSYHNHSHELAHYDGKSWLARLYEETDPSMLKAEIDTYWIQHGGGDPVDWIKRMAGREPLVHLKDMQVTPEREQRFGPVGKGNLNWRAILAACEKAKAEFLLVEQDKCYDQDPFDALAESYRNLKIMGYS